MHVQCVANERLLAALHRSATGGDTLARRRVAALDDFEAAQRALEQAPPSAHEIRARLAPVRDEWLRLLGQRSCSTARLHPAVELLLLEEVDRHAPSSDSTAACENDDSEDLR